MIKYDPKDLLHLVSSIHGTVLPQIWKRVLLLTGGPADLVVSVLANGPRADAGA